jgi:competence ComEA-like helix-hairpin-helix protein
MPRARCGVTVTRTIAAIGLAAAIVLNASLVSRGQASSSSQPGSGGDDWHAAERLTVRICSDCHSLAVMTAERRTPNAWLDVVDEMGTRTDATAADLNTIRRFFTRTHGIVEVNTAQAADFVSVLGLSQDVAEAVIAYRTVHGRFADRDAILKVPGLGASGVELDAQALWFD